MLILLILILLLFGGGFFGYNRFGSRKTEIQNCINQPARLQEWRALATITSWP